MTSKLYKNAFHQMLAEICSNTGNHRECLRGSEEPHDSTKHADICEWIPPFPIIPLLYNRQLTSHNSRSVAAVASGDTETSSAPRLASHGVAHGARRTDKMCCAACGVICHAWCGLCRLSSQLAVYPRGCRTPDLNSKVERRTMTNAEMQLRTICVQKSLVRTSPACLSQPSQCPIGARW